MLILIVAQWAKIPITELELNRPNMLLTRKTPTGATRFLVYRVFGGEIQETPFKLIKNTTPPHHYENPHKYHKRQASIGYTSFAGLH